MAYWIWLMIAYLQLSLCVSLPKFSVTDLRTHVLNVKITVPTCAIYKQKTQVNTPTILEKFENFWRKISLEMPYSKWNYGVVEIDKVDVSDIPIMPSQIPSLACHVGLMIPYMYNETKYNKKQFHRYLLDMTEKFGDAEKSKSIGELNRLFLNDKGVIILAFTGLHEPNIVDKVLFDAQAQWKDDLRFYIVDYRTDDGKQLIRQFSIRTYPVLVFLNATAGNIHEKKPLMSLSGLYSINSMRINLFMITYKSGLQSLKEDTFNSKVLVTSHNYQPFLVCFYAHWGQNVLKAVSTVSKSFQLYSSLGASLKFGLLHFYENRNVNKFPPAAIHIMPFVALFWKELVQGVPTIRHEILSNEMPTPYNILKLAKMHNVSIFDGNKDFLTVKHLRLAHLLLKTPCASLSYEEFKEVNVTALTACHSGPKNVEYEDNPLKHRLANIDKKSKKKSAATKKIYEQDKQRTKMEQLPLNNVMKKNYNFDKVWGIPVITDTLWQEVVERSNVPQKPYSIKSNEPSKQNAAVTMVIFIKDNCGSCTRKSTIFQDIAKSIKSISRSSIFVINCDKHPKSCKRHGISGFPSISAFRNFGWFGAESCLTKAAIESPYVRLDYHGAIEVKYVMDWFSKSTISATKSWRKNMDRMKLSDMKEDVRVIATVYPSSTAKMYLPSKNQTWYPLECFKTACERMYGQVECYFKHSTKVPWTSSDQSSSMIVSEIIMERRDMVSATIVTHGHSLADIIESESENAIHRFHSSHRYQLSPIIRCEDNYPQCTDFIVAFVRDHMRLPVTRITLESFHIRRVAGSQGAGYHATFASNEPVLIALVNHVDTLESSPFYQELQKAAYALYQTMAVTVLNVEEFPTWVSQFVPIGYHKNQLKKYKIYGNDFRPLLYRYPRLCIVRWSDHNHAAFYPPLSKEKEIEVEEKQFFIKSDSIISWVHKFKKSPDSLLLNTETF